jgi:hypothetical protein
MIISEDRLIAVSRPPDEALGPLVELLSAELARYWFERSVKFDDHLGEGICQYLGMLALRKFVGKEAFLHSAREKARRYRSASARGVDARPSAVRGLGENVSDQVYEVLVRSKIPVLLLYLEAMSGGVKPFVRALRRFAHYHRKGQAVGWPEFLDVVEKESGRDLSTFALLYVDGRGIPTDADRIIGYDLVDVDETPGRGAK